MQLLIESTGNARCIYNESLDLTSLGQLTIARGSHVEPNEVGEWFADLAPVEGPLLGPFQHRSEALNAEAEWLESHWVARPFIS
jgi:hypothetical protein